MFELLDATHDFVVGCTHTEHCYGVRWGDFLQHQGQGRILVMRAQPENIDCLRRLASFDVMCAFVVPLTLKAHEEKLRKERGLKGGRLEEMMARAEEEVAFASERKKTDLLMVNNDMDLAFLRLENWALNEVGKGWLEEETE
jgi:guanylate kinase